MNLMNKVREMFSKQDDTPDIIEDIFTRHSDEELLEIFHTELEILADTRGIGYFEAFAEHISNSHVDIADRREVEAYLTRNGLCDSDIKQLLDKFFDVAEFQENNG